MSAIPTTAAFGTELTPSPSAGLWIEPQAVAPLTVTAGQVSITLVPELQQVFLVDG